MAGIRTFNTNLPHVHRLPEWTSGVFYPKGSIVAEEITENGQVYNNYYVAIRDVQNRDTAPSKNQDSWRPVYEDPGYDSEILALLKDSDFLVSIKNASTAIQGFDERLDSEMLRLDDADSDLRVNIARSVDSESTDRKAADVAIETRIDQEVHDLGSADSDIKHLISQLDSDIAYLKAQADSDSNAIAELKKDVVNNIDSEIRARLEADSDFDVLITQVIHDYLGDDSEIDSDVLTIKRRLDSEFDAAIRTLRFTGDDFNWDPKPWQSNTRYYVDEGTITNHIIGHLWIASDITDSVYIVLNGVLLTSYSTVAGQAPSTTQFIDGNGIEWRRGAQIEESPGDPADIAIYQNTSAGLPLATNGKVYGVAEKFTDQSNFVQQTSLEDAFRRTVTTIVNIDSDVVQIKANLGSRDSDLDSELGELAHDIERLDSDVLYLRRDVDSDSKVLQLLRNDIDSERHDWKAGDSDLRVLIASGLDSDIQENRRRIIDLEERMDSEIQNNKDRDSEILNGYTSVTPRWIKTEQTFPSIGGGVNLNFNAGGTVIGNTGSGVWIWNSVNDRLVVIDSDNTVLYNEVHAEEPTVVSDGQIQYRRGVDTGSNSTIQVNGATQGTADAFRFFIDYVSKTKNDGVYTPIIDSDLTLKKWDSDNTAALVHIVDTIQEEVHWRRSRDSELGLRITDNDSDIAYINQVGMFFRGSIDMTKDLPPHTAVRTGDVYLSTKTGTIVDDPAWKNLADTGILEEQFVMYTDSDQWRVLGGLGEGGNDSENIAYVDSIRNYRLRIQRDRFKFHFAEQSQTLFFEGDSEEFFIVDAESWNNKSPVILEGRLLSTTQVQLYFGGVGRNTSGNLFIYDKNGVQKNITNSFGLYGDNYAGNGVSFSGFGRLSAGTDSEDNTVRLNVQGSFARGDKIQFLPDDGLNVTWIQTWDNLNFKRIPKIKLDLDSDVLDRKAAVAEIHDRLDSEYHDRRASDSDIYLRIDSEYRARKSADSDLSIRILDNDSDIAYLYGETVKFRGTIDPTVDAPAHNRIQPGDLYVSYKSGSIANGWAGIVGYGVTEGDALLYTDSDKWIFLGASGSVDSEHITIVPSASWYLEQNHVVQNKLHWGSRSRALFAEVDSDVLLQVLTDHENFSRIIDGETEGNLVQRIRLSFSGGGPKTNGILKYITQQDGDFEFQIVSGATATFENDSDLDGFALIDSENQVVRVQVNFGTPVKGDIIEYRDSDLGYASRVQYDGGTAWVKWNHAQWLREDVDSEFELLRGELVGQAITGFRVGTILPFSQSDMPVGFRLADGSQFDPVQYPALFQYLGSNTLPNLQGAFLRGMSNSIDYNHLAPTVPGQEGLMNIGSQDFFPTGFIVPTLDSEQPHEGVLVGQRFMDIRLANVGGMAGRDGTDVVLEVEGRQGTGNINRLGKLIISGDPVGYSPGIDGAVINIRWDASTGDWYPSYMRLIPDGPRSFEGTYQQLWVTWYHADGTIRYDFQTKGGKEYQFMHFENQNMESPVTQIDIVGQGMSGRGTFRELQFAHFARRNSNDIQPQQTRSYAVAYGIAMYNGAGIVYDSEILEDIWRQFANEIDSEMRRMDSDLQYNLDSEYRARKDADSDLLSQSGRTFVGDNPPTGINPALRNGDTWIDSSDQRLYYYDAAASSWIQVISSVQP